MQLKVTHTFDTQLFSQVSPFSTFQRRSLQDEKHLDQNLGIFLILKNFSRILEKFHFSISISRHFHFTFHSRKEWTRFSVHFSLLGKSERDLSFTFHFSKRVNQIFISLFTSRKKWKRFIFHFHFSNFQYLLSQDTAFLSSVVPSEWGAEFPKLLSLSILKIQVWWHYKLYLFLAYCNAVISTGS